MRPEVNENDNEIARPELENSAADNLMKDAFAGPSTSKERPPHCGGYPLPDFGIDITGMPGACFPRFRVPDFVEEGKKAIARFDRNGDGALDKNELESASENHRLSPKQEAVLGLLQSNYDTLGKMSKDGKDGITAADLEKEGELQKSISSARKAEVAYADEYGFAGLDKNSDNYVSKKEIEARLKETHNSYEAANLQYLLDNYNKIMKASNDEFGFENNGISKADLHNNTDKLTDSAEGKMVQAINEEMSQQIDFYPWGPFRPPILRPHETSPGLRHADGREGRPARATEPASGQ